MPQFELEAVGPDQVSGLHRGKSPEEAVRRAAGLDEETILSVDDEEDLHGWRAVSVDGALSGRIRLHQRMRFRRD